MRCLPGERCPCPLWPHLSLVEAEDRRWVPISLTNQLHIIPFLHQCRGRHDLQIHVLRGVWGKKEQEGSVQSPTIRHRAVPRPPVPDSQKTVTLTR